MNYVWNSTGSTTMFTFWDDGEPNNVANSEHCTMIGLNAQGLWRDVTCNFSRSDSICEKSITKPQIGKKGTFRFKIFFAEHH